MDLQFEALNASNSGLDAAFREALADVMAAIHEQEAGDRKDGPLKISLTVAIERRDGGVRLAIETKVGVPPRSSGKGRYASLTPDGKFMVDVAKQTELFGNTVAFPGRDAK